MARSNILFVAALVFCSLAWTPAYAVTRVTTDVEVSGWFVDGTELTGYFGVTWVPIPPPPGLATNADGPVKSNPFSFSTGPGSSQNGSTLNGFTYDPSDANISLNANGDTITVTSPADSTGPIRQYQVKLTFQNPLIDLVDGSVSSDPFLIQGVPYPTAAGDPISGECENPFGTGTSFCRQDTRRFLASGGATGVPEPATWLTMLLSFAGLGFASYRKARNTATPARA